MRRSTLLNLCIALLATSCAGGRDDEAERSPETHIDDRGRVVLSAEARTALGLETAIAERGSLTTSSLRFGKVIGRPQEDAVVVAPLTGRLGQPALALGARVSTGDLLLTLEPLVDSASRAALEAQIRELQGQIAGARAQVDAKRSDLSRVSTLLASGLATEADRAQAEAALTGEQARLDSLSRADSELARMTGGRLDVRAPAPGIVATLATDAGSLVQQGSVLARIVRMGPRWIEIAVPPGDPVGTEYRVQAGSNRLAASLLTRGVVIQSDGTRRDRLEAEPEAVATLLPGATVAVEVLHETQGILVPTDAVVRRGRGSVAFVEAEEGRFEQRPVDVAAHDDTQVVVTSGLSEGERILTRGAAALLGELGSSRREPGPGEPE